MGSDEESSISSVNGPTSERRGPDAREGGGPLDLAGRLALRPREAAKALGLSERSFRTLLHRLPHFRAGSAVLIPVDELRRWLSDQARRERSRNEEIVAEALRAVRPREE